MSTPFERGFRAVTGRNPTEADIAIMQENRKRAFKAKYPDEPSTLEKVAAFAAPIAGSYITKSILSDKPTMLTRGVKAIGESLFGSAAAPAATGGSGVSLAGSLGGGAAVPAATTGGSGVTIAGSLGGGAPQNANLGNSLSMGSLGTALGVAGGAYGLYELGKGLKDQGQYQMDSDDLLKSTGGNAMTGAAAGAALGSVIPGVGTAVGALLGGLLGGGASAGMNVFGSGKSQDQLARDEFRSKAIETGALGSDYMVNDVDLGKDGGFKFEDGRRIYEIAPRGDDGEIVFSADQAEAIGKLNPLGSFLAGGDDKYSNQLTSMYVNAAQEGGDEGITDAEIRRMYDRTGLTQADIFEGVNEMYKMGRISEDEARAQQNAINQLYGQEYYSPEDEDMRAQSITNFRNKFF
jgi:hypothetical protein